MPSKARRWLELVAAILLVLLADLWSRQPPERFSAGEVVALDVARANPEKGLAYRISLRRIASGLASDKDGFSRIMLLEDGEELTGHALHADIRNQGGGLFSHWGGAILFSTRDGSDPRTNGRRYEVRLPSAIPDWHRPAQIGLLAAAGMLLLHWLHGMAGGSLLRTGAWTLGGAAGLASLVLGSAILSSPARELRAVRQAVHRAGMETPEAPEPAGAAVERPRTRHLLRGGEASFTTGVPPPAVRPPRTIVLRPSDGAARDGGYAELDGDAELRNVEPLDVRASDLESMVLEIEAARGGSLILHLSSFEDDNERRQDVELSFQVSASSALQTFRFRRPAIGGMTRVHHVAVRKKSGAAEPPIVRVASLRYSLRLDAFSEQASGLDPVELGGSLRPALWQSVAGRFSFPLEGDGSLLKLAVGALADAPAEPIDFAVAAVDLGGRSSVLHRGSVVPRRGWQELSLTLPEGARELLLEAERLVPRSALLWSGVRLIDRRRPPRRLVLILADTLRADALGCYGHGGDPTPALDALAYQGVRFERAFSQSYWTRPSMASLMTGRYVAATGVQTSSQQLPEAYETLAERLAGGGFTTVGVLTNTNAGPHAGLEQGFDRLRLMLSLKVEQQQQTDRLITEVILPVLDDLDDDDVFLYLHLMEPHGPYGPLEPPADLRLPVGGTPLPFDSHFDRPWNPQPTAAQRVALYDYDVRSVDRALGRLFAWLDRRWSSPGGEPPILAFVSDHGEVLGERDQWGHGFSDLYPENVRVPMILRAPGRIAPDTEVEGPVEIRHLGATLLDLVGLVSRPADPDSVAAWRSLLPLLEVAAEPAPPTFAISAAEEQGIAAFSLFGRRHGYVARIAGGTSKVAAFSDPALERRVTGHWPRPLLERELLRLRRSYLDSQARIRERLRGAQDDSAQIIDPQALENLKALGYLQD